MKGFMGKIMHKGITSNPDSKLHGLNLRGGELDVKEISLKGIFQSNSSIVITRKYPLRGYILGILTHKTAWRRHWRGDETMK